MNSKKAITLLILATMIIAMVPLTPAKAIVTEYIENTKSPYTGTTVGDKGDTVTVFGSGVTAGADVSVYWDNAFKETFTSGSGKLNTTEAEADGGFEIWFKVPAAVAGDHYIWVKDMSSGDTYGGSSVSYSEFTVMPKVSLSPDSGLSGDTITMKGSGFGDEVDVDAANMTDDIPTTVSYSSAETDELGSWETTFKIPSGTAYHPKYNITVIDDEGNSATAKLKVGASIELSQDIGPTGTDVTVTGRGFTPDATFDLGDIDINGYTCWIDDPPVSVRSTGKFTAKIVIPGAPKGEWEITATEVGGLGRSASADFEIDGVAEIEVDPEYGPVGSYVEVEGWNFTQISGEEVTVTLDGLGEKTFDTDSNGHFKGTFRIPGAADTAVMNASMDDYYISAETNFRVGLITVILTPEEGPAGTRVSVSGGGFEETDNWNATFDGDEWIDSTGIGANGVIAEDAWAPSVDPGVYEVIIWEETSEIKVTVEFTVTEATSVETSPVVAPNDYNVSIMGHNFAQVPDDDSLEFLLYNETDEWELDVTFNGEAVVLEADEDWDDGYFKGYFVVPSDEDISLGTYTLNVTDGEGMFAQYEFSVVEKTQQISPRKPVFSIGETVSFNVELSFAEVDSYIEIYDPDDDLYWTVDEFDDSVWVKVGTVQRVPYYSQTAGGNPMLLLTDAPLGEYTWEYYDDEDELIDDGVFTVEASQADVLAERIEDLNNDLMDLSDNVAGVSSEIANVRSDINSAIQAANAAVQAANAATEAVNAVAQTANSASQAAQDAASAAEEARSAAQGLTTLVYGAIGAALVAALAAIVSLMQISQKIAG